MQKLPFTLHPHVLLSLRSLLWFVLGASLGLFFFISFVFIFYQKNYVNRIYPGVYVAGVDFGGKSQDAVRQYFGKKNHTIQQASFTLKTPAMVASISAKDLGLGYDENLLANQAYSIGRSSSEISNISLMFQAYISGIRLPATYHYKESMLRKVVAPIQAKVNKDPVDALFTFENNRVTAFRLSQDGQQVDMDALLAVMNRTIERLVMTEHPGTMALVIPIKTLHPNTTTDEVNKLGITELIASGTSLFQHSIENRIYNISLAASRLNGLLVPPGQIFSFNKTVGDISSLSGYKQAYVIENGHTVLGDGGGVCQVSTTFFRAVLAAGLPIVERHAHAYRVGYYEQDSLPGIDAAIYSPSVDFKFKNDTANSLLITAYADTNAQRLTFWIYGTKDNREVSMSQPIIHSQSPAPEPLYQDDPTLAKGIVKQVDFAAAGANVSFTRQVKKDGKVIINDTFTSNYRPWQAVYLQGTKEQ